MPPYNVAATRKLLSSLYLKRVAVPLPDARRSAEKRADASARELPFSETINPGGAGLDASPCQLGEGPLIPGYRLVISIEPRNGSLGSKAVLAAEAAFAESAPAVPDTALPHPELGWGRWTPGVRTRDWEATPRSGVESAEQAAAMEIRPPAPQWNRRPRLSIGRLATVESKGWARSGERSMVSALFSQPGEPDGDSDASLGALRVVLPSGTGEYPRAGVPRVTRSLRPPLRLGEGGGLPMLEPVSCSFASGGALWDSLI
jgi:hypothetical protein